MIEFNWYAIVSLNSPQSISLRVDFVTWKLDSKFRIHGNFTFLRIQCVKCVCNNENPSIFHNFICKKMVQLIRDYNLFFIFLHEQSRKKVHEQTNKRTTDNSIQQQQQQYCININSIYPQNGSTQLLDAYITLVVSVSGRAFVSTQITNWSWCAKNVPQIISEISGIMLK